MTDDAALSLAEGLRLSGETHQQLWIRYFALGGAGTLDQLHDYVTGGRVIADEHEYNIIAQALNEVFIDAGGDHPVAYRRLYRPGTDD